MRLRWAVTASSLSTRSFVDEKYYEWIESNCDVVFLKPVNDSMLWLLADYVASTKAGRFTTSKTFKFVQTNTLTAQPKFPFNFILVLGRL